MEIPDYLYKIGENGKLKSIYLLDIKCELNDCQMIIDKYYNGYYGVLEEKE